MRRKRIAFIGVFVFLLLTLLPGLGRALGGGGQYYIPFIIDFGGGGYYNYNVDEGNCNYVAEPYPVEDRFVLIPAEEDGQYQITVTDGVNGFYLAEGHYIDVMVPEGGGGQYQIFYISLGGGGHYFFQVRPEGAGTFLLQAVPLGDTDEYLVLFHLEDSSGR